MKQIRKLAQSFDNWLIRRRFEKDCPGQDYFQTKDGCIHVQKVIRR